MHGMHISGGGLAAGAQLPPRAQHRRPSASKERGGGGAGGGGHSSMQSDSSAAAYPPSWSTSDRDRPRVSQHSSRRVIIGGSGNPVAPTYSPSWSPIASSQQMHDWTAAAAAAARPAPPADLYGGRATPDPPKGSYRLQPHEQVSHPPTAPPAQQRQPRPPPQPRNAQQHANGGPMPPPPLLQSHTPRIMFESKQTANGPSFAQNDSGRDPRPPPHHQHQHQSTQLQPRRPSGGGGEGAMGGGGGVSSRIAPFQPNGLSQALQFSAERRGSGDRGALAGILSAAQIHTQQPQQHQHHAPSPAQHNAPPQPAARGSLQQTIQSARSSAYSQLTLQHPSVTAAAAAAAAPGSSPALHARHLSNSPSPNSTPVKPSYSQRDRHAFDKLHVFDSSPLATPKEMAAANRAAAAAFARAPSSSAANQGQDEQQQQHHHRIISEGQRRRALSNAPQVALSWPSELSSTALSAASGGRSHINVRSSQPLPSPSASSGGPAASSAAAARNFPAILKRGAQLIQEKPPVLSPARALELQLDEYDVEDYGNDLSMALSDDDDDEQDDQRGRAGMFKDMPPQPDFSAAAFTIHGHAAAGNNNNNGSTNGSTTASGNQNRSNNAKNGRVGSASSNARVGSASASASSHKKNSGSTSSQASNSGSSSSGNNAAGGPVGMKKLDVASAQAFRSPYNRKSFASRDGPAKPSARSGSKGSGDFLPAEEWVLGASSSDEDDVADTDNTSGGGGGGGGWILDVGMAEDANPRFRASMEDAHVIRRRFGPRFIAESSPAEKKEMESGGAVAAATAPASAARGSFFSVFDGHGGRGTVDFLASHFHRELGRCIAAASAAPGRNATPAEVQRAIEAACAKVDGSMAPHSTAQRVYGDAFQDCGSTACFVYLRPCGPRGQGREVFFSNVGDAQAVLAVDKQALQRGQMATGGTDRKSKRASGNGTPLSPQSSPAAPAAAAASHTDRTPKKSKHRSLDSTSSATDTKSARGSAASSSSPLAKTIARGASTASSASSRSVVAASKLTALPMSYPHVATDPKEIARIKAGGGVVFANRVGGCLAVSRAFGDFALKDAGVSSVPYQQHVELTAAHRFLIIGCDGVWDVLSFNDAVQAVAGMNDAQSMAQKLVDLAMKKGTTDNVSCMVVRLRE